MNYKPKKYEIEILKVLASGDVKIKKDLDQKDKQEGQA